MNSAAIRSDRRPYAYLDSSAIVKLVVREEETSALEGDCAQRAGLLTSRLAATERTRAARRVSPRQVLQQVEAVLESFVLVEVSVAILTRAGHLDPPSLRTLDAIHIATAEALDVPGLAFVTYDDRLAGAAALHGLALVQPGRTTTSQ
jgi:predicted nucleic acid-binding protein